MNVFKALFEHYRIARAACLCAALSLAAGCAGGGAASSPLSPGITPQNAAPSSATALPQPSDLASDTTACAGLQPSAVQAAASAMQTAAQLKATAAAPGPNVFSNPEGFRQFALASRPTGAMPAGVTSHPMTSLEYATFRAAAGVTRGGLSTSAAIAQCSAQALAAKRVDFQNCGSPPCNPPPVYTTEVTDTAGNKTVTEFVNNKPVSQTSYSSSGQSAGTGSGGLATMSGVWVVVSGKWVEIPGPVPGWTHSLTIPGAGTITGTAPGPAYVPQSGWMSVPGTSLSMYIDPSGTYGVLETGDAAGQDYYTFSQSSATSPITVCGHGVYNGVTYNKCLPPITFPNPGSSQSATRRDAGTNYTNWGALGFAMIIAGVAIGGSPVAAIAFTGGWLIGTGAGAIYYCFITNCLSQQTSTDSYYNPWPGYADADTIIDAGFGDGGAGGCATGRAALQRDCITDDGDDEW